MLPPRSELPVDQLVPEIIARLSISNTLLIEAPPGSGKTTRVAPSLIDSELCDSKRRILLLQPRRVAAKATAQRIAEERGWQLGQEVGYQVRFESKVTASTALIVATEGVLLRRLATDPAIQDINTVILDEFHERSLNADLILGMLRQVQQLLREDLRVIVMSATLDAAPLEKFLGTTVLRATGTLHPVEIQYRPPKLRQKLAEHAAETTLLTLEKTEGDVLVFLPGLGEISQTEKLLRRTSLPSECEIMPLHGSLPLEQQSRVLRPSDRRKVILSTNVAETSLTIEGIRTVVDSGQARVLRFNPAVGLDRLQLEPICQSSATQRAGRAGRVQSGTCIRLWEESSHRSRSQYLEPEIRRVDLSAAALQLFQWGEQPTEFPWFEAPRETSLATAIRLLEQLGAVQQNQITAIGKRMASLPVPPRIARMLIESEPLGQTHLIAMVAAMLSEREPFLRSLHSQTHAPRGAGNRPLPTRQASRWNCDVTQRALELQRYFESGKSQTLFGEIHRGAAQTIRKVAEQFMAAMGHTEQTHKSVACDTEELVARALLVAFPDRLAKRRKHGDNKGVMVGGRGVKLGPTSGVQDAEYFLCIDVDDATTDAIVRQASRIELNWLPEDLIAEREELFFNPTRKQVEARRRSYWHDLRLCDNVAQISDDVQCAQVLYAEARKALPVVLPDAKSNFHSWLTRIECLKAWAPELELPACDEEFLSELLYELCRGKRGFAELRSAPWLDWLKSRLSPAQLQAVERECPEKIEVPSGSRIKIDYQPGSPPVLAVRIQELFSWTQTPRIAFGRVPLLLHLLAPNFRPQQVTDDLTSFWSNTYDTVKKELRRRYPKHAWPDDPLNAKPECRGGGRSK